MRTLPNDFTVRMPWGYCGNEIWNRSRQAEVAVLTAERLAAMELLLGGANREAELERAWKNLLVGQHHDIQICGLLADARKFLSASTAASTNVLGAALQFVAAQMRADGAAQVTVFNPLSWPHREWVEAELTLPKAAAEGVTVRHEGQTVPTALLKCERSSGGMETRIGFMADLPVLGFAAYSIHVGKEPAADSRRAGALRSGGDVVVESESLRIHTPFLEAQLDPQGGLAALRDPRTGASLLALGKRSGSFVSLIDGEPFESHGKWVLHSANGQEPWASAREYGFIGQVPYTLEIRFRADTARLDCRASFHFEGEKLGRLTNDLRDAWSAFVHEDKLRFELFPAVEPGAVGVRDLPFAISETTNRYIDGLYWTALADSHGGVAFFNRGTMGAVREKDGGFALPLAYSAYYIWGTRPLTGDFVYEFALEPFTGDWRQADLHRKALAYNFPPISTAGPPGAGTLGETVQPLALGSENVLLTALYPDNGQVYGRLFEFCGRSGESLVTCQKGKARLALTDLFGREEQPVSERIAFRPWQFRTLRIEPVH
jgi:hypothetical protein